MLPRMNGQIPNHIHLAPMLGQEMLAFTVGKHHLELVFLDTRLIVQGGYELSQIGQPFQSFSRDTLAGGAGLMPSLLSRTIQSAKWLAGKGLLITFSGGMQFIALVDGSGYESFSFGLPHQPGAVVV